MDSEHRCIPNDQITCYNSGIAVNGPRTPPPPKIDPSNQSSNPSKTRRLLHPRLPRLLIHARRLQMECMRCTTSVGLLRLLRMVFNPRVHKNPEVSQQIIKSTYSSTSPRTVETTDVGSCDTNYKSAAKNSPVNSLHNSTCVCE
ncbi:unnamed protein product [Ectocarpus sp. 8 AP-2014]